MDDICFEFVKRLRTCVKKRPYPVYIADRIKESFMKRGIKLRVYHCPYCNWFHLTKKEEYKNAK